MLAYIAPMSAFDANAAAPPGSGIFGLPDAEADAALVLIPVPFDATTSYRSGAAAAPSAILSASHQIDLYDLQTGRAYERGIHLQEIPQEIADLSARTRTLVEALASVGSPTDDAYAAIDSAGQQVNEHVFDKVRDLRKSGKLIGLIGGDHSIPFGAISAIAGESGNLGILHVDAHADLRPAYQGYRWSHASIMDNVLREIPAVTRVVQVGVRDFCEQEFAAIEASAGRVLTYFDLDMRRRMAGGESFADLAEAIVAALPERVYVSLDIDGLDPSLCPHTGTPVPGGLSFSELCLLLETLSGAGKRIVGFDLSEVATGAGSDSWDADVAARVLYKLCGFSLVTN